MTSRLDTQASRFYTAFAALARAYQFRDRESVCCHGLSVTQCYALEALERSGPLSMGQLAEHLWVELSSMTRAIDPLVEQGLATRREGSKDRRIREIQITSTGRRRMARIHADLVAEYREVLGRIPRESREVVIDAVGLLLQAFEGRAPSGAGASGRRSTRGRGTCSPETERRSRS